MNFEHDGKRYVYLPAVSRTEARDSALRYLMKTFFEGSRASAVSAILEMSGADLSEDDLERLSRMIKEAKGAGR